MSERGEDTEPDVVPHEAGMPAGVAPPVGAPADEPAPDGASRPSVAPRVMGWRDETLGTAFVTLVVGIWLIFSPEALGYGPGDATLNPVICGVLVTVFSIGRILGPWRTQALGLITFLIGAWLAVSSFLFQAPIEGQWNQGLFGGIISLISLIGLAGSQRGQELNPD